MIDNPQQYAKAKEELAELEQWLARLQLASPFPAKGLTKAGIRKKIARLQEEIGVFEGTGQSAEATSKDPHPV